MARRPDHVEFLGIVKFYVIAVGGTTTAFVLVARVALFFKPYSEILAVFAVVTISTAWMTLGMFYLTRHDQFRHARAIDRVLVLFSTVGFFVLYGDGKW